MNSAALILGFAAGATLAVLFYGGLWITVRALLTSQHPVAVTMGSLLFRMAVTGAGFLMVARWGWEPVATCLAGFVIGRVAVSRLVATST